MGKTLVIVDDAPFIREVIKNILEKANFQVVGEADNGTDAVDLVLRERPDLVIMDIVMPHKSGIEATVQIIEDFPEARIVAVSTLDQKVLVQRALDAGCCEYVVKPFTAEVLLEKVKGALLCEN